MTVVWFCKGNTNSWGHKWLYEKQSEVYLLRQLACVASLNFDVTNTILSNYLLTVINYCMGHHIEKRYFIFI